MIADSYPITRKGMKLILANDVEIGECGEAGDSAEVIEQMGRSNWDVLIMDINLPERGGLETLRYVKGKRPKLPVLLLLMPHMEHQYGALVFKAGAAGYLTNEYAADDLIFAIKKASRGEKYVSASQAQKLALYFENDTEAQVHNDLSVREFQIMSMLVNGKRIKDIARSLSLSVKTVSNYKARIMEKMSLNNDAELVRYAVLNGLVESTMHDFL